MAVGLDRMLDKILANPKNSMLVDRFLKLISDDEDSDSKYRRLLALAEGIREADAIKAISIAYEVFENSSIENQTKDFHIKALEILISSMDIMGKSAKAAILKNELERLKKKSDSSVNAELHEGGFQLDITPEQKLQNNMGNRGAIDISPVPSVASNIQDVDAPPPNSEDAPSALEIDFDDIGIDIPSMQVSHFKNGAGKTQKGDVETPPEPDMGVTKEDNHEDNHENLDIILSLNLQDTKDEEYLYQSPEGVISPGDDAANVIVSDEKGEDLFSRSDFWDKLRNQLLEFEKNSQEEKNYSGLEEFDRRVNFFIDMSSGKKNQFLRILLYSNNSTDDNWKKDLTYFLWHDVGFEKTVFLLNELGLENDILLFWDMYLEMLVDRGLYRRVLFEVRCSISENSTLEWIQIAYGKLLLSWKYLRLRGFTWTDAENPQVFVRKLQVREDPTMASSLVISIRK